MVDERFTGEFYGMSEEDVKEKICVDFNITRAAVDVFHLVSL